MVAVALADEGGRDAGAGDQARALGGHAGGRVAGEHAVVGVVGRLCLDDGAAEHAERERLAAAAEHGGRGEGAHRGVGVERVAAPALGGAGEGEDRGVVGEEVVGGRGVVGCGVAVGCEVRGDGCCGWRGGKLVGVVVGWVH